jgi:hypothetical protein
MKTFIKVLVLLVLSAFIVNASAMAVTTAGTGLQGFFDSKKWGLDVDDDQMETQGGWMLTNASGASNMVFYHGVPDGNEFGIYSIANRLEEATVFDSKDIPIAKAVVSFDAGDAIVVQYWNEGGLLIDDESYRFTGEKFGFWIGAGTNRYYSDADRNDVNNNGIYGEEEDIAFLVYNADPGSYVFAGDLNGDKDFFNVVTQAESIKPVHTPVPPSIVLLGTALIGFVSVNRKKNN